MTSVKAKLVVVLKADDVVVAEVDDPQLWQAALSVINGGAGGLVPSAALAAPLLRMGERVPVPPGSPGGSGPVSAEPIDRLASELNVDRAVIEGALSPSFEPPYIHLNSHNWEAMRKQLPVRGPSAISSIGAAATLTALWFRTAGLGNPTQAQALEVLETIGETDRNPSRGVRAATWLIARPGGQIQLNASEISMANKLGTAFCQKSWSGWGKSKAKSKD